MNILTTNPVIVTISDAPYSNGVKRKFEVIKILFDSTKVVTQRINNQLVNHVGEITITGILRHYESDGITEINNTNFKPRLVSLKVNNFEYLNSTTGDYTTESDPNKIGEYDYYINILFNNTSTNINNIRDLLVVGITKSDNHPNGSRFNIK